MDTTRRSEGASAAAACEWRDISTAPKDGTVIDLWGDNDRFTDCFWGLPDHHCGEMGSYCDSEWHGLEPGWVSNVFNQTMFSEDDPTHWRPLPGPPINHHAAAVEMPRIDDVTPKISRETTE